MGTGHRWVKGIGLMALGVAIAGIPTPSLARSCGAVPVVAPSPQMKPFQVQNLGLSLEIPNNYRAMLRSNGHITFHDPSSFEFIQCLVRTGEYGAVPPYVSLEVYEGIPPNLDLVQTVRRKRPWVDYYNPEYQPVEVADRPAVEYTYAHEIYGLTILNISFFSDDRQTLITLSGPADHPIMQNALSTLAIAPSDLEAEVGEAPQE